MKKLLIFCLLCLLACSCESDDTYDTRNIELNKGMQSFVFSERATFARLEFTALEPWAVSMINPGDGWCSISQAEGGKGAQSLLLRVAANETKADRSLTLVLRAGSSRWDIPIIQVGREQLLVQEECLTGAEAGTFDLTVESNVPIELKLQTEQAPWLTRLSSTTRASRDGLTAYTYRFRTTTNQAYDDRYIKAEIAGIHLSRTIRIRQAGKGNPISYRSTDFSADGKIVRLQRATAGKGIDLVIMGDAYSDRLIADGSYELDMYAAMEAFFAIEPYTSLRPLFNVYMIEVVSVNQSYFNGCETALGCRLDQQTISGNDAACKSYAMRIPGMNETRFDNTLIIVLLNTSVYGGTSYLYPPATPTDYASGLAISYFTQSSDLLAFTQLLQHEAGGHGFAKLADEYGTSSNGALQIPDATLRYYHSMETQGWYRNVDFTSAPTQVKWSHFLKDDRYASEQLGVHEGACGFSKGAYRSTPKGLMRDNTGGFNAPSREAIYYRAYKLAYGDKRKYDYDAFVRFDQSCSQALSPQESRSAGTLPHTSPIVRSAPL